MDLDDRGNIPIPDPSLLTTVQLRESEVTQRQITDMEFRVQEERRRGLADLTTERFSAIHQTFVANDTALQAALRAQKEAAAQQNEANTTAIDKSEQAMIKLLSTQAEQLNDLKSQVLRLEALKAGGQQAYGAIYVAVALLVATVGATVAVITLSVR